LALARFIAAEPAWLAERACCCPSRPSFRVLLQTRTAVVPVDLLLCGHHFRSSRARLAQLGAWAYDQQGDLLSPDAWRLGGCDRLRPGDLGPRRTGRSS